MRTFYFNGSLDELNELMRRMHEQQQDMRLQKLRQQWGDSVPDFIVNTLTLAERVKLMPQSVSDVEYRDAPRVIHVPSSSKKRR